ncbi:hypothetical protein PENTCL1PPCAC_16188, partial [Pristionchus entomophagus]
NMERFRSKIEAAFGIADGLILMMCGRTASFTGVEGGGESGVRAAQKMLPSVEEQEISDDEGLEGRLEYSKLASRSLAPIRRSSITPFIETFGTRMRERAEAVLNKAKCDLSTDRREVNRDSGRKRRRNEMECAVPTKKYSGMWIIMRFKSS